jgi:Tir chaperone protein (CesT) family
MVMDLFGTILEDLGKIIKINDLHPDKNNSCLIKYATGLEVQMEIDRSGECLVLGSQLGVVISGRYRENVFREALKANGIKSQRNGVFAYSKKNDQLILFEKIHIKDINAEKIAAILTPFAEKALIWKTAITQGDIPSVSNTYASSRSGGMFGLKR